MKVNQARILEWVAIPFSGDLPSPGIEPWSSTLQAFSLPSEAPGKAYFVLLIIIYAFLFYIPNQILNLSRGGLALILLLSLMVG